MAETCYPVGVVGGADDATFREQYHEFGPSGCAVPILADASRGVVVDTMQSSEMTCNTLQYVGVNDRNARLYYWYHRPSENWPPEAVQEPGEIRSDGRLSVWCTQTHRNANEQRKLVARWCETLPTLKGVRHLWLGSRVPQKLFDAACRVPGLESLYIKWSGIKKLNALEHADGLRYLHIGSSTGVESIQPLGSLKSLRWLGLEKFTRIRCLDPLADLVDLEGLTVEGSEWTTQNVETLAPIGKLLNLRYLAIANLRSTDQTLSPLFTLRRLEVFYAAKWWDCKEWPNWRDKTRN